MTELDTKPLGDTELDDDEDDGQAHYVRKEDILKAAIDGVPAVALCGKTWFPGRDPSGRPLCPRCKEMMEALHAMQ